MEKISTIKDRILTFLQMNCIKKSDFYQCTGLSDSNFKGKNRQSQPGGEMLVKILTSYPNLSADWLLTGQGDMMKGSNINLHDTQIENSDETEKVIDDIPVAYPTTKPGEGIPLIPISAMAGALTGEVSVLDYECDHYVVPIFKGADFLVNVKGSSMYPKYASGDIVACKRIPMTDLFFQWNKVYVIDTNQGPLIKRIKRGKDDAHIKIVSDNENYEPFELPLNAIYAVALVIGVIRLE